MNNGLPLSHPYNLNRLGQAGDDVSFSASDEERAALARFAGVLRVDLFAAHIVLRKPASPSSAKISLIDLPYVASRRTSASTNSQPRRSAKCRPIVVLPEPR